MSNTPQNDGGPAFPVVHAIVAQHGHFVTAPPSIHGMSLRDWFAGMALQGLCSGEYIQAMHCDACASLGYKMAEAMLAARNVEEASE